MHKISSNPHNKASSRHHSLLVLHMRKLRLRRSLPGDLRLLKAEVELTPRRCELEASTLVHDAFCVSRRLTHVNSYLGLLVVSAAK